MLHCKKLDAVGIKRGISSLRQVETADATRKLVENYVKRLIGSCLLKISGRNVKGAGYIEYITAVPGPELGYRCSFGTRLALNPVTGKITAGRNCGNAHINYCHPPLQGTLDIGDTRVILRFLVINNTQLVTEGGS